MSPSHGHSTGEKNQGIDRRDPPSRHRLKFTFLITPDMAWTIGGPDILKSIPKELMG